MKNNKIININIDTKANDLFKILVSGISTTEFLKLYNLMNEYLKEKSNHE